MVDCVLSLHFFYYKTCENYVERRTLFYEKVNKFNFEMRIIYDGNGDGRNRVPS